MWFVGNDKTIANYKVTFRNRGLYNSMKYAKSNLTPALLRDPNSGD